MSTFFKALLCSAVFGISANGQIKVVSHPNSAEIIDVRNGYSVEAPPRWYVSEGNPIPFMFSYPPRNLKYAQVGVPLGGAQISIVAGEEAHKLGSIDKWVDADRKGMAASTIKKISVSPNPLLSHIIQVVYYEDVGDAEREQVITTTKIYFLFHDQPYAAVLSFNANDPKARQYQKLVYDVLRSVTEANKKK